MKLSSFEEIIKLQFNAYMMITIKGIVRYRRKQRTKRLEHEALFNFLYFKYVISQSRYLTKNWVRLYANCLKSNVTISCCAIFKICGTERLRSFIMYHVLL